LKITTLHRWDVSVQEALRLQRTLSQKTTLRGSVKSLNRAAGCDVAYDLAGGLLYGGVVVWDLELEQIREAVVARKPLTFPYVTGLLSFREGPVLLEALGRLRAMPEVILVDGQGVAHPRGIGLATHIGLHVAVPTVGCAKSRLIGEHTTPGRDRGDFAWLVLNGRRVGAVVRTRAGVRPVYVSPGNRIDLEGALGVVLACLGRYRLPEPLRQAHLLAEREAKSRPS
jgi:deoxyribonuclease V